MEPWESEWIAHKGWWELEMLGQPGLYAALMAADALDDMGPERFLAWWGADR